ncbi:hypothetical protein DL96DRAFT_1574908 [Flagelloscypha sp. PMI_526]|nr:hypothetical protein DL96DRAFT_1574908 [Flagelloscypha sp. PMI_526]
MNKDPTYVHLPDTLSFPIEIVSIDAPVSSSVSRGSRLLSYKFGTIDSATKTGEIQAWNFKAGDFISARKARERPILVLLEPCKHEIQYGGMCANCGKNMMIEDYLGASDASRASIQMNHSSMGPTVSLEVAKKLSKNDAERLQKAKKLSLIVDLDQTIVHATVDPTVGEWISEGEAWETRQSSKSSKKDTNSTTPEPEDNASDECNPNWDALKDVKKFKLAPDIAGQKGAQKHPDHANTMYYIKPRPGWQAFFNELIKKYEMHVYTMGTRAYAEQVCRAIDPESKIFGGRILTRDESGSLTQKSLSRLFPVDTSMVVIIDDRADVWDWSPNLVKVIPYDFFVGIGDINSAFLPKQEAITAGKPSKKSSSNSTESEVAPQKPTDALVEENSHAIEAQVEARPLAKAQEQIDEAEEIRETGVNGNTNDSTNDNESKSPTPSGSGTPPPAAHHHRKALLKNDDVELSRIQSSHSLHSRKGKGKAVEPEEFDVTRIIPGLRSKVLEGVHIMFSGVIPLNTTPETTEVWRMARMFGAACHHDLSKAVTHLVAANLGTTKVTNAQKMGRIHIVELAWLTDSVAYWRRMDEKQFYLDGPPGSGSRELSFRPEEVDGEAPAGDLELDVDWADINDEVDAAMNESDDDDDDDGMRSQDEWSEESNSVIGSQPSTPTRAKKRIRSITPSDAGSEFRSDKKRRKLTPIQGEQKFSKGIGEVPQEENPRTPMSERSVSSAGSDDEDFLAAAFEDDDS